MARKEGGALVAFIGSLGLIIAALVTAVIGPLIHSKKVGPDDPITENEPAERNFPLATSAADGNKKTKNLNVVFVQPKDKAIVPQFTNVQYNVLGQLPRGYHTTLFIQDPVGQYWSWGSSRSFTHKGIQVGVSEDKGLIFEIGVLVTDAEIPFGVPLKVVPPGILYRSITVTRE